MRIIVANSFHYRRGGDSAQFLELIAALESRGHEVAVFSMQHPLNLPSAWSEYWVPYIEYRGDLTQSERLRAGWRSIHSAESARCMSRLLSDFQPAVVHFHSVQHHLTLAAVEACVSAHTPVVWTLHDYRTVCPATSLLRGAEVCERCANGRFWHGVAGRCKSGELSRSVAAVVESYVTRARGALGAVDCYVAPSYFLARKVVGMGLPAKRIEVVPNAVFGETRPMAAGDSRGLLYVGRLSAEKGVNCLIRAAAGLPEVPLRIIGDGPGAESLKALALRQGADVVFEGWADKVSVRARMSAAELLCVPSIWYENCPGVVLEAMVAGLPIVASDLGGLPELLEGGQAGWLAPAGDSGALRRVIRRALDDKARTAQQAARALSRVLSRHDPDRFVSRIEGIYRSLETRDRRSKQP